MKFEKKEIELHEEGVKYDAHLLRIEDAGQGTYGPQAKWVFTLVDAEDDREIWAWSGMEMTPRAKLTKWVKNLNDGEVPESVDTADYVGVPVFIIFEQYDANDGNRAEKVSNVLANPDGTVIEVPDDEAIF